MSSPPSVDLSLTDWLVLAILCEEPRHGFAVENNSLQVVPDGPPFVAMRRRPVARSEQRE